MAARLLALVALLFGAEVVASWWIWTEAPTDSIRVRYSSFEVFERDRLVGWIIVFASVLIVLFFLRLLALRKRGIEDARENLNVFSDPIPFWTVGLVAAISLEVFTSVLYWKSSTSLHLRRLYESVWYWNRVPQPSDIGWPSFRIYMWQHFVPWAIILLLGLTLWHLLSRRKKTHPAVPIPVGFPKPRL
jgi:hypothetical protein